MKHFINWVVILILGFIAAWMASVKGYIPAGQIIVWIGGYVGLVALLYVLYVWWSVGKTVVVTLLAIGLGISWLVSYLFEIPYSTASYWGWAIWSITILPKYESFLVIVDKNTAQILVNNLRPQGSKKLEGSDSIEIPTNQRAVFTGINFKWPWETTKGEPIIIGREVKLSGEVTGQADDNKNVTIKWKATLGIIPDQSVIWHDLVADDIVKTQREAEINRFVQSIIQGMSSKELILDKKKEAKDRRVQEKLDGIYAGKKFDAEKEVRTGRYVRDPQVESIELEQTSQDALEQRENANLIADTIEIVLAKSGTNALVQQIAVAAALRSHVNDNVLQILNPANGGGENKNKGKNKGKNNVTP